MHSLGKHFSSVTMAGTEKKFTCTYCQADVTDLRVKCADASCSDFHLCLQCLACGAEIGDHKKNHKYQIVSAKNTLALENPLFPSEKHWKAKEDLELLGKVIRYGTKNWEEVSNIMGTKTPEEAEKHFFKMYIEGNIGQVMFSSVTPLDVIDHTEAVNDPGVIVDNINDIKEICSEIKYRPLRDDFDEEFDSKAEGNLSGFHFSDNDDDEVHSIKCTCMDIYRSRLQTRSKRKKFVKEYHLIEKYSNSQKQKSPSKEKSDKEEISLREKLKSFCRLLPASDFDTLIKNSLEENKLQQKIKSLQLEVSKLSSAKTVSKNSPSKADQSRAKSKPVSPRKSKENKHKQTVSTNQQKSVSNACTKKETKSANVVSSTGKRKRPVEVRDLSSSVHCYDLLSGAEKKVCSNLDIEPSYYMALKMVLLKERNIMLDEPEVKTSLPTDLNKTEVKKLTNFMVNNGWISG